MTDDLNETEKPRPPEAIWSEPMLYPPPHPHEMITTFHVPEAPNKTRLFAWWMACLFLWAVMSGIALMTVVGWWVIPAGISATAYLGASQLTNTNGSGSGGYFNPEFDDATDWIIFLLATVISLAAWLVWALL
jgi:hypothetical protein